MVEIITRDKARFRIQIYDFRRKKTKTISLRDGPGLTLARIKKEIEMCFQKPKKKSI